jgi:hypothetical protein
MRIAKVSLMTIIFICMYASGALSLTTKHIATDAEMLALISDTLFVAEGRIGDLGGAATFELDLGNNTSNPSQTAQYAWVSGQQEPFTITYNSGTGLITFILGGKTLTYTTPYGMFGDIFVRTRAVDAGKSVVVQDLVLDGVNVGDLSSASGADGLDILWVSGGMLADGFTLTGVATLSWTGSPPTQSRLAFQVKVAKLRMIGVEGSTWGGIKGLFE